MAARVVTFHWFVVASLLISSVSASAPPDSSPDAGPAGTAKCGVDMAKQPLATLRRCSDELLKRGEKRAAAHALLLRAQRLIDQNQPPPARSVALDEADYVLRQAAELLPTAIEPVRQRCALAELRHNPRALERHAKQLIDRAPRDPQGPRYHAIALLAFGRTEEARRALEHARMLGLDPKSYRALTQQLNDSPRLTSWWALPLTFFLVALCTLYIFRFRRRAK